jgi:hypothetical protein
MWHNLDTQPRHGDRNPSLLSYIVTPFVSPSLEKRNLHKLELMFPSKLPFFPGFPILQAAFQDALYSLSKILLSCNWVCPEGLREQTLNKQCGVA